MDQASLCQVLLREKPNGPCRAINFRQLPSPKDALDPCFTAIEFWGAVTEHDPVIVQWIRILETEDRVWNTIAFKNIGRVPQIENQVFGAILSACSSKTENLIFMGTMVGEEAYLILKGILQTSASIKCLGLFQNIDWSPLTNSEANAFMNGLAAAKSLERLHLGNNNFMDLEISNLFSQGLSRNESLKEVVLFSSHFHPTGVSRFMKALEPTLERFDYSPPVNFQENRIFDHPVDPQQNEAFSSALINWITKPNCKLKFLRWKRAHTFAVEPILVGDNAERCVNVSVRHLCVPNSRITSQRLFHFLPVFQSLVCLDLSQNKISDLTLLLDTILSTNSHLEHLGLGRNQISSKNIHVSLTHFAKLRVLQSIGLSQNPFLCDEHATRSFVQSISINQSIERCQLYSQVTILGAPKDILVELGRACNINRGFRRGILLSIKSSGTFPSNLWSLVLERISKLAYYQSTDEWKEPADSSEDSKADVVYSLLKAHLTEVLVRGQE